MAATIDALQLDRATHTYTYNGVVVPSVTQVLNEWIKLEYFNTYVNTRTHETIPADPFEYAGEVGDAIHKAAFFILGGNLVNMARLKPVLVHPINELNRWIQVERVEPVIFNGKPVVELMGYIKSLNLAGTMDNVVAIKRNDCHNLVDIKSGQDAPMVGPQTAGYELIYRELTGYKGMLKRWVLYLPKKEGKQYRFIELKDRTDVIRLKNAVYNYSWDRRAA